MNGNEPINELINEPINVRKLIAMKKMIQKIYSFISGSLELTQNRE